MHLTSFNFQTLLNSYFGVDITLVLFGLLLIYISKKLPKNREDFTLTKIFNKGKTDEKTI